MRLSFILLSYSNFAKMLLLHDQEKFGIVLEGSGKGL